MTNSVGRNLKKEKEREREREMVVTTRPGSKKLRRTVSMSGLKKASNRMTHLGLSPFLQAQDIPPNSYEIVTNAWQGFHMIPLDPESIKFTRFKTEFGRYRYKRNIQGDHVSMDAYNFCFDKITSGVDVWMIPYSIKIH